MNDECPLAYFLLADGTSAEPDMNTALELSNVTLSSDTCFSFYFEMKKDSGVNKMKVIIEQSSGDQHEIWTYTTKLDFWDFGQILIQKDTNFKVAKLVQQ